MKQGTKEVPASTYGPMGDDQHGYEPCYAFHEEWHTKGLHCHDFYEIYIHYNGAKYFCMDNSIYEIVPYQLIIIPPFTMHGNVANHVPRNYERAFLYITPSLLKQLGSSIIDLNSFLSAHVQHRQYLHIMDAGDAAACKTLLQEMRSDFQDTATLSRLANQRRLLHFFELICKTMKYSEHKDQAVIVNEAMHEVLSYINENYVHPVKLEVLAHQFGISVSYLSHSFAKYTGRSVYDYIIYRRILQAKEMLYSDAPLGEIATKCGFPDYSSFLRSFKKITGVSPKEYRRRQMVIRGAD